MLLATLALYRTIIICRQDAQHVRPIIGLPPVLNKYVLLLHVLVSLVTRACQDFALVLQGIMEQ